MRGIVEITGTAFDQHVGLAVNGQSMRLVTTTPDSAALMRLGGVEVAVRGTSEQRGFRVSGFTAVSVSGAPVVDGVLHVDGASVALETRSGKLALGNPPDALRRLAGARVWVSGPIDKGPNSYGVIVPPR